MIQLINDIHETAQRQYSKELMGSIKFGRGGFVYGLVKDLSASHAGLLSM
jgi:hypothetical protein